MGLCRALRCRPASGQRAKGQGLCTAFSQPRVRVSPGRPAPTATMLAPGILRWRQNGAGTALRLALWPDQACLREGRGRGPRGGFRAVGARLCLRSLFIWTLSLVAPSLNRRVSLWEPHGRPLTVLFSDVPVQAGLCHRVYFKLFLLDCFAS